jgi:hypothetical protein
MQPEKNETLISINIITTGTAFFIITIFLLILQ